MMGGVKIQGVVIKLYLHDVICMRCSDRRMRESAGGVPRFISSNN